LASLSGVSMKFCPARAKNNLKSLRTPPTGVCKSLFPPVKRVENSHAKRVPNSIDSTDLLTLVGDMKSIAGIICLILALGTAAHAEQKACAWVLWSENNHRRFIWTRVELKIIEAFQTLNECQHALILHGLDRVNSNADTLDEKGEIIEGSGINYRVKISDGHSRAIITDKAGGNLLATLLCLPDTIDPRSPKR